MIQFTWINQAKKYSMPNGYELKESILNKNLHNLITTITEKAYKIDAKINSKTIKQWFDNNFNDWYYNCVILQLRELNLEDTNLSRQIENLNSPFNDTEAPQNSMLVSLNAAIFGNYVDSGSFTAGIFFQNESVLGGDDNLKEILNDFFTRIGLDPSLASILWNEGQQMLIETGENKGCLLQLFDESARRGEKAFSLLDRDVYVSFRHGIPVTDLVPSDYIQGHYFLNKRKKDLELRLVVNNQTTLNPFQQCEWCVTMVSLLKFKILQKSF